MSRYGKRADLIVHEYEPFNAETAPGALAEGALTATDAFYVRGHGAVPETDPERWRLRVHGLVERELDVSLATLREALPERTVTATLQCAGNRRAGLIADARHPRGGAVGAGRDRHRDVDAASRSRRARARRAAVARPPTSASRAPTSAPRPSRRSASAARSRSTRRAAPRSCSPGR